MTEELNTTDNRQPTTDYIWLLNCSLITAIAAFLRFFWLELKPLHHDEGVNGYFLTTLFRDGVYKYDPANYHGPDLYYIALGFSKVFGLNTIAIRSSVAIFGVLTVFLAFFLKKYIGKTGSLAAAMFLALSPGMVYISRYFIHEMLFVFFSFAIVIAVLYFIEGRKAGVFAVSSMTLILLVCFSPSVINLSAMFGVQNTTILWSLRLAFFLVEAILVFFVMRMLLGWSEGRPIYLLLASASVVLLAATKETGFITLGTMAIACFCVWLWRKINAVEDFEKPKFGLFLGGTILMAAAVLVERTRFYNNFKSLSEKFLEMPDAKLQYVFYGIIALGIVALIAWLLLIFTKDEAQAEPLEKVAPTWANFRARLGEKTDLLLILTAAVVIFIYIGVLFFSSFFTYPEGVKGAFEAYAIWTKTGNKDHTQNGFWAYLKWGMHVEAPIFILSALGTVVAIFKARHRFAMFAGLWAFGLFAAYTIIPYKTPWLALSFLLPMCIVAGYGVGEFLRDSRIYFKITGAVLGITATAILAYQTYDLNFVRYDDNDMTYIYAHTTRGFLELVNRIEYYADKSGKGKDATIEIVSPDYWSMPWYLNDYNNARFSGQLVDANTAEMIVAKKEEQDAEIITRYSAHYKYAGEFPLRPGVDLILLVRKDLADSDAQEISKGLYRMPEGVEPFVVRPLDSSPQTTQSGVP
ncbi:hypothetical protein BH10ACI1_BH10ACI1_11500 [soil metagenome]